MRARSKISIALTSMMLLLSVYCSAASAEKRVALIIGNAAYQNVGRLLNPSRDSDAVAAMLKSAGFDLVTVRHDLGVVDMKRALREFWQATQGSDVAVLYYAGHGIQVGEMNYMIPVDAKLAAEVDVQDEAVSLDRLLDALQFAKRLRLVILDACRENPFSSRMRMASRSILNRGLARIEPDINTLVAYAAKSGQVAQDGKGDHSPFTAAILKHLAVPELDVRLAFGRVRDEVLRNTANAQEPFVYGSLGGDAISLFPASLPAKQQDRLDAQTDYQFAERIGSKKAWDTFLAKHNAGIYADLAREHIAKLVESERKLMESNASSKFELSSVPQTRSSAAEQSNAATELSEEDDYRAVERIGTKEAYDAFLARHQGGSFADLAREQLASLVARERITNVGRSLLLPETATVPPTQNPPSKQAIRQIQGSVENDYRTAEQIGTKEAWDAFLSKYDQGTFADLAREQIAKLVARERMIRN